MNKKISLLGLDFDNISIDEVIESLLSRHPHEAFAYVVTPNVDHFTRLRKNPSLMKIYGDAFLCLLDSRLLYKILESLNRPRPNVVTGADLAMQLLKKLNGQHVAIIRSKNFQIAFESRSEDVLRFHEVTLGKCQTA